MKATIKLGSENDFFERGKEIARRADAGEPIPSEKIITFADQADLIGLITKSRMSLIAAARQQPGSIQELADRLNRQRSAVSRDVAQLAKFGLIIVEEKPLPGHGVMKEIRAAADHLLLTVY